jgi:hypothetical protein
MQIIFLDYLDLENYHFENFIKVLVRKFDLALSNFICLYKLAQACTSCDKNFVGIQHKDNYMSCIPTQLLLLTLLTDKQ